jgi:hypothetical protein
VRNDQPDHWPAATPDVLLNKLVGAGPCKKNHVAGGHQHQSLLCTMRAVSPAVGLGSGTAGWALSRIPHDGGDYHPKVQRGTGTWCQCRQPQRPSPYCKCPQTHVAWSAKFVCEWPFFHPLTTSIIGTNLKYQLNGIKLIKNNLY